MALVSAAGTKVPGWATIKIPVETSRGKGGAAPKPMQAKRRTAERAKVRRPFRKGGLGACGCCTGWEFILRELRYIAHRACWLCGRNGSADPLDRHHIFGGARKKLSEKYGLLVDLCNHDCHIFGEEAVHNNAENMQKLHEYGQRICMERYGMSKEEFIYLFGKNYLSEDEPAVAERSAGGGSFHVLDKDLPF